MDTKSKEIHTFLKQRNVKLSDIIHLLCQYNNVKLKDVAIRAGLPRERIYMMASGQRPVNEVVRQAFKELLGIDPWESN